jgi:hypothetical protein
MTITGTDFGLNSNYARLVQRLSQHRLPWVESLCVTPGVSVISRDAMAHWARHDPEGLSKVAHWLHEQGVTLVRI